jgi:ribonucleoside-triphosphate reductase
MLFRYNKSKGGMGMKPLKFCKKRNGAIVSFDKHRITTAITKAFLEAGEGNRILAGKVTESVVETIMRSHVDEIPTVEDIQDIVEETLMGYHFTTSAKKYILYRDSHARSRV